MLVQCVAPYDNLVTINSAVDYTSTYSEYPILAQIHGKRNYVMLQKMKNELVLNAASIPIDLGEWGQWPFRRITITSRI